MRGARVVAWLIVGAVAAAVPAFLVLNAGAGSYAVAPGSVAIRLSALVAGLSVGALLALKRPSNPIAWLLLSIPIVMVPYGLAGAYAGYELNHGGDGPGIQLAAVWDTRGWPPVLAGLVAIAFVFPDGRLPSPRWRWAVALGGGSLLMVLVGGILWNEPLDAPFQGVEPYSPLAGAAAGAIHNVGLAGLLATVLLSALALRTRFTEAEGEVRAQIKWVAYAAVLIPVEIVVGILDGVVLDPDPGLASDVAYSAAIVATTSAIAIAVLRYRLYDIDVVINRTLVYGGLTATLAAAYLGSVLVLQLALGGLTEDSNLAIAGSTLAVAALFRPARSRIQQAVDKRFYRRKYDAQRTLESFASRLRDEVDLSALDAELRGVVAETMQPAHVSLWLRGSQPQ